MYKRQGTYGKVINQTSGGNVGSFLYSDPEDANKFCYYKNLSNGRWILPAEATANTLSNVKVSYSPMAYIEIAGDGVTGSEGSYALTTSSGNTVAFTATAKTAEVRTAPTLPINGTMTVRMALFFLKKQN